MLIKIKTRFKINLIIVSTCFKLATKINVVIAACSAGTIIKIED